MYLVQELQLNLLILAWIQLLPNDWISSIPIDPYRIYCAINRWYNSLIFIMTSRFRHWQHAGYVSKATKFRLYNLLIVTDDLVAAFIIRYQLKADKIAIRTISPSVIEERLKANVYDLIFITIGVRYQESAALVRSMRSRIDRRAVPIIALAMFTHDRMILELYKAGLCGIALLPANGRKACYHYLFLDRSI